MRLSARLVLPIFIGGVLLAALGVMARPGGVLGEDLVVERGPALSRYDEVNDTTLVVTYCGHAYCDIGHLVEGDVRDVVEAPRFALRAVGEDPRALVRVEPLDNPERPGPVTQAYQGPYEVSIIWPRVALLVGGVAVAAVGVALGLARIVEVVGGRARLWPLVVVPALGALVGMRGAAAGVLGLFVLFGALILGCVALVGMALLPRGRAASGALFAAALAAAGVILTARPFFPSEPEL